MEEWGVFMARVVRRLLVLQTVVHTLDDPLQTRRRLSSVPGRSPRDDGSAFLSPPRFPDTLTHLVTSRLKQQRDEEAPDLYRTLAAIDPCNADAHSGVDVALSHPERRGETFRSFPRVLLLTSTLEVTGGVHGIRMALEWRQLQSRLIRL